MILSSAIYLGSSVFNKAVPFLLLPLLTKYLTPAEYGKIALFQMGLSIFIALYGGLHLNISKTYFNLNRREFSRILSSIYFVLVAVFLITTSIVTSYYFFGGNAFGLSSSWLLSMPIISAMSMANLLNLTLLRSQERPLTYAKWEISHSVLNLAISYVLVAHLNFGSDGRILGISAAVLVIGALGTFRVMKQSHINYGLISKNKTKQVLAISLPLIPHVVSSAIITSVDLLFIRHYMGKDAVGIYSIGYQFGMVVMLFSDSFLKAWQPWFFKTLVNKTPYRKVLIVKGIWKFIFALSIGACLYGLFASLILPHVADSAYIEAKHLILPISLSYIFFGLYQIVFPFLVYAGKTTSMAIITPLAAFINIALNYLLIPQYGYFGAILATAIAYFIMFASTFYMVNKYIAMPWLIRNPSTIQSNDL